MFRLARIAGIGGASLAMLLGSVAVDPSPAQAKQFDVVGTIFCNTTSGNRCDFKDWSSGGPTIGVVTNSVSGNRDLVYLNGAWVKDQLPRLEQDDDVTFSVDDAAQPGKIMITGISDIDCGGTKNIGLSTASHCHSGNEQSKHERNNH